MRTLPAGQVTPAAAVADLLRDGDIYSAYQPIVDLDSGAVVAVEALVRGPEGPLHMPARLFPAAEAEGLSREFEWACRAAALRGALNVGLPSGVALFINVEPSQLGATPPPDVLQLEADVRSRAHVVLELTERELVLRPADVLRAVYDARARGWGVALDDVGADPASLALMPVVRPDVVKLDMSLIHQGPTLEAARVASAVGAYAEESGAAILVEGIEDDLHLERAIALGATLGQGWLFGQPDRLELVAQRRCSPIRLIPDVEPPAATSPFELVGRHLRTRIGRKSQLLAMSRHLERQAAEQPTVPLLMAAFQDSAFFTPATQIRYAGYALESSLVAVFGVDLIEEPAPGVRGATLDPGDPLASEWTVVVLSPHFAGALIARDMGDPRGDVDRRFEFAVTHDRHRVTAVARCLVDRVAARS